MKKGEGHIETSCRWSTRTWSRGGTGGCAAVHVLEQAAIFSIAPYVGYMNFGDYFESGNNVEFSNENGALYGAQAQLDLGRFVSLVGNFGYSSSKFTFENTSGTART
jgi:hypothetical protein